ncbi:hypothetical protein [Methylorubrum salsuginis]|uniref:Uncharacterized protein n=1 Tax=Methylorubrum salsuginis TaxID=414703 RepID=A0A1I4GIL4_9HYPH|nr:hypothetical protein [Methylorubrum salsuginis]SFL29902.1 hypothetical protein SAMN04488125_11282 [Methylorubrum salsuginis]
MSFETVPLVIACALSLLPPIVFVGIRQAVKINRQEIVRDLAAIFSIPASKDENLIPSFEFVKYKYFFHRLGSSEKDTPRDHSYSSWILGAIPLVLLLFVVSYLVAVIIWPVVAQGVFGLAIAVEANRFGTGLGSTWIWSLCSAFAGGYVFMIRSFYRAINNFDLSPLSFAGACNNLLVGIVGAEILSHVLILPIMQGANFEAGSIFPIVLLSFAIGYLPESATRTILWRSDLINFKRENRDIYKQSFTTPIEIIDGIDTEIRDRLADYHISSTQNLATANPLMLFVETPFGVYQIMDWVAQAQLCCSVGPNALTKFWKLGIRTLFDLERIALDADCYDEHLLSKIGDILIGSPSRPSDAMPETPDDMSSTRTESTIIANIVVRLDDPHVHRLRQIYIKVGDRLGMENRRFRYRNRKFSGRCDQPECPMAPIWGS